MGGVIDVAVVLSAIRDYEVFERVRDQLSGKWFADGKARSVYLAIKQAHADHPGRKIPWEDLKVMLRGKRGFDAIPSFAKRSENISKTAKLRCLASFVEAQMVEDLAQDLARAQQDGEKIDHAAYIRRLESAQRAGSLSVDRRNLFDEEPTNWIQSIEHIPVVSLPSFELTQALRGGIAGGRPTTVLTRTDGGKTSFAVACGAHAVKEGKRVLHCTFEDSADEIFRRYSCSFTNHTWDWVHTHPKKTRKILVDIHSKGGDLEVADFSGVEASVSDVNLAASKARRAWGRIDLIIIDAGDDVETSKKNDLQHEIAGEVWRGLTRLSRKHKDVPILITTQTNRLGAGAREIDLTHIGESWHKAKISAQVLVFDVAQDSKRGHIAVVKTKRKGIYPRVPIYFDRERCVVR